GIERKHAGEDAEQRRLAGAVDADQGHALAALDLDVDARVDDVVGVRLADPAERGHAPSGPRRLGKREANATGACGDLDPLDPIQHLDPALDLARLGRLIPKPLDAPLDL